MIRIEEFLKGALFNIFTVAIPIDSHQPRIKVTIRPDFFRDSPEF